MPSGGGRVERCEVVRDAAPGDGQLVAVEQAGVQQFAHHDGHAAGPVEVAHQEPAGGAGVDEVGDAPADAVEVGQRQVDAGLVRDREQVQYRVRGPADGHDHRDRVLQRSPRDHPPGPDVGLQQRQDGLAARAGERAAARVDRRRRRGARQAETQRLDRARHRVRGVHPAAGALGRAGGDLDRVQARVVELPGGVRADGLEDVLQVDVPLDLAVRPGGAQPPGEDRAAVAEHRR